MGHAALSQQAKTKELGIQTPVLDVQPLSGAYVPALGTNLLLDAF